MRLAVVPSVLMAACVCACGEVIETDEPALVEYLGKVDSAFICTVETGGVNRAVVRVESALGCGISGLVIIEGYNSVDVNSAHYRIRKGDRRLVLGYRLPDGKGRQRVLVPSIYSGCFPIDGENVVAGFYEGGAPVTCRLETLSKVIGLAVKKDGSLADRLGELLKSPVLEDRYCGLALSSVAGSRELMNRVAPFLEDDNPVMREAAALNIVLAARGPDEVPDPAKLDAGGIRVVMDGLDRRLDRIYGAEMEPWVPVAAAYAARALELRTGGKGLSSEMYRDLGTAVDETFEFLITAAPFGTDGMATLLAYPGTRAMALTVMGESGDGTLLPLVARYVDEYDLETSAAAISAIRKITGDVTVAGREDMAPFLKDGRSYAREKVKRIRMVASRAAAHSGLILDPAVRVTLLCGNRAVFHVGPDVLLRGGDLSGYEYVPWKETAYPAALPYMALGGLDPDEFSRSSVMQGLGLMTRRFPAAAPWLHLWGGIYGAYGGLTCRYYALRSLKHVPLLTDGETTVVLDALGADEYDVRRAAVECAVRHGLPVLDFRATEDPDKTRMRRSDLERLWKNPNLRDRVLIDPAVAEASLIALWDEKAGVDESETAYRKARQVYIDLARGESGRLLEAAGDGSLPGHVRTAAAVSLATLKLGGALRMEGLALEGLRADGAAAAVLSGVARIPENPTGVVQRAALVASPDCGADKAVDASLAMFRLIGMVRPGSGCKPENVAAVLAGQVDQINSDAVPAATAMAGLSGAPGQSFWLEKLRTAPRSQTRRLAVLALGMGDGQVPAEALNRALNDDSGTVVYEVCRLIQRKHVTGTGTRLLGMLDTMDTAMLRACLLALSVSGEYGAAKAMRSVGLIADDNAFVVEPLVAMGGGGGKKLAEEQIRGTMWQARYYAVQGLAGSRERWAKEMLLDLYLDPRERLSACAEDGMLCGRAPELMTKVLVERSGQGGVGAPEMCFLAVKTAEVAGIEDDALFGEVSTLLSKAQLPAGLRDFIVKGRQAE
ncbi:MAG: hypothetical protein JW909_00985 [Planctomycetes bacterium]|nr:hypothetical protein [Planctomycetota bacterium]